MWSTCELPFSYLKEASTYTLLVDHGQWQQMICKKLSHKQQWCMNESSVRV